MLEAIVDPIKLWAENTILKGGYTAIGTLMMLDSANIPIPSEVIMPLGGMLSHRGEMNFHLVAWVGATGSWIGSCISYGFGYWLGRDLILKYGRFVGVRAKEYDHSEKWFQKYGLPVTLWGRFVPLVRTFISLPAGVFRANFRVFALYAFLGALPWSYLWTYIGYKLNERWAEIGNYMKYIDIVVIAALVALAARFFVARRRRLASQQER